MDSIKHKKAYTSREILTIAYPILISLVMEQAIGMTDTAFLGRVGEIELGLRPLPECIILPYSW